LPVATLDIVINNADRKVGHIFLGDSRIWAIDHGLSFHVHDKLRTVLWSLAGEKLTAELIAGLERLIQDQSLLDEIEDLLGVAERTLLVDRVEALLANPIHPGPPDDRPAMPWPHF